MWTLILTLYLLFTPLRFNALNFVFITEHILVFVPADYSTTLIYLEINK